jgi:hypothetical protein
MVSFNDEVGCECELPLAHVKVIKKATKEVGD